MTRTTVLVVEDHKIVSQGLRMLLENRLGCEVVGEAPSGEEAVRLATQFKPMLALVDIHLPDLGGLDVLKRINALTPPVRTVILSSDSNPAIIEEALLNGAAGYLLKESALEDLEKAIQAVLNGDIFLSQRVNTIAWARAAKGVGLGRTTPPHGLSPRELEVLRRIAGGQTTKEIAADLHVGVKTAETYRHRLMQKLKIHSVADLTRFAIRQGIIQV